MSKQDPTNRNRFLRSHLSKKVDNKKRSYRQVHLEALEPRMVMAAGIGLTAQYYNNSDLTALVLTRVEPNVNFNWGAGSPSTSIGAETFSARFSGQVEADFTETYTFKVTADDGARLYVNGQLLIDRWSTSVSAGASASINLIAGRRYDIQLDYKENTGNASVKLEWSRAGTPLTVIPTGSLFPSERGSLTRELWSNVTGSSVASLTSSSGYPNNPNSTASITSFEAPSNFSDNYGQRIRGFVSPTTTGKFTFYVAGDDNAELWLSNSTDPTGKQLIATVPGFTNSRQWTKYTQQKSASIDLVAGQSYYIEALHKEGAGGDNLAVGWSLPGATAVKVIAGEFLSPLVPKVSIFADAPRTTEGQSAGARFVVTRGGVSFTNALTVQYTTRGTATSGTDFTALSGSITIPAGQASATLVLNPLNDNETEGTEQVTVELLDGPGYSPGLKSERTAVASIQDNQNAPSNGVSLWNGTALSNMLFFGPGATFTQTNDPVQGSVLQAAMSISSPDIFDTQLRQTINQSVKRGDVVFVEFLARSTNATVAKFDAVFERTAAPYNRSLSQNLQVTNQWTKIQIPFIVDSDYAAGEAHFSFHTGQQVQTIQFAAIQVLNFGPSIGLGKQESLQANQIDGTYGTVSSVAVTGQPFSRALQIQTTSPPTSGNEWKFQVLDQSDSSIRQGDRMLIEFFARSTAGSAPQTTLNLQRIDTYATLFSQTISLTGGWQKYQFQIAADSAYAAAGLQAVLLAGYPAQTIEVGGFQWVNLSQARNILPTDATTSSLLNNIGGTFGSESSVAVTGQSFSTARQVVTTTQPTESYRLQLLSTANTTTSQNDYLMVEFYARSIAGASPKIEAVVQNNSDFRTILSQAFSLTSAWQRFTAFVASDIGYSNGGLQLTLNLGFAPQTVQVGGMKLLNISRGVAPTNLPQTVSSATYGGRSGTDSWRSDADARIAQNRQANLTVNVRDSAGNLVNGAVVNVRQTKQGFKFGTAVSGYDNLLSSTGTVDALKYQNEIKRLFNTAVIENNLKWPDNVANPALAISSANWVVNNGLYLRGHNVVWPARSVMPTAVWSQYDSIRASQGAGPAAIYLRDQIRARVQQAAVDFAGKAGEWDILNEPYANTDVFQAFTDGGIDKNTEVRFWFSLFRQYDANAKRVLNDYDIFAKNGGNTNHVTNFGEWLSLLKSQNLIETIGEQSHYNEGNLTDIPVLGNLINQYNTTYGLPIAITELDVNSKDEQFQADYLRDYITQAFSQSGTAEIVQWGFWSGSHWLPDAALYRNDFSIKPNGQVYEDLVFGKWWTDVRGTTRNGSYSTRAFQGNYDVTATLNGQTVTGTSTLGPNGITVNLQFGSALRSVASTDGPSATVNSSAPAIAGNPVQSITSLSTNAPASTFDISVVPLAVTQLSVLPLSASPTNLVMIADQQRSSSLIDKALGESQEDFGDSLASLVDSLANARGKRKLVRA
jgi:GH35 family endo-1,4-beta-xylanase